MDQITDSSARGGLARQGEEEARWPLQFDILFDDLQRGAAG
jgi:hypothetical protein